MVTAPGAIQLVLQPVLNSMRTLVAGRPGLDTMTPLPLAGCAHAAR